MAAAENNAELKRKLKMSSPKRRTGRSRSGSDPCRARATKAKKRKGRFPVRESPLEFERVYLDNLPSAAMYERSYCTETTDFIITASQDGHVKFWKKKEEEGNRVRQTLSESSRYESDQLFMC
ncbi:Peptidylprolyl isomerase domain and WD repeat-containing protein 1 [Nibea albiflora]|uniref:Peptidylprolyl isomerase domain and WD repeat-containing protein 1 n=1 Tax=Nibea albiflora TaxID=240163 RepID=A0ACB7F7G5_NIBAL|nr:Peptidylprolyl isomerase domain and WD repeat-containing protein 1 [Nibea albiflora]